MATQKPTAKQAAEATEATEKNETAPAATQAKPAEPTSPKLEELKKAKTAAMSEAAKAQMAGDEKAAEDKFLEVYKIGEDIKKEIAEIRKHEAELLRKEKEAAIVKLFDDAIAAYANHLKVEGSKASIEEKNAASNAYKEQREKVVNRLLGSRPAAATTGKTPTGTRGATGSAIHQMILDNLAAGMTLTDAKKAIVDAGYSRGTTGAVATQMIKDGEIKA